MKQLYIQAPTQHPKNIEDAFSVKNQSNIRRNSNRLAILNPKQPGGALGTDNREWKGTGLCKGPPGRPRSPGIMFPEHPPARLCWSDGPDGGTTPDRVQNPLGGDTHGNTEIQIFKNNKFNYYSQSNFTIMKKYLFILILAVFASVTVAFGQGALPGTAPRPISCVPDALHPTAGVPYVYTLDATPTGGTWTWYATKNTTFMAATVIPADSLKQQANQLLPQTSDNYGKATPSNSVTISWSDAVLGGTSYQGSVSPGTPTFVVAYYTASGVGTDCSDNMKVYELDPKFAFTVDVLNLNPTTYLPDATTYAYTPAQCVDKVQAASYTAAHQILYDYGTNYLYYEFVASNFTDFWIPTFAVTGTDAAQTLSYDYTYAKPTTWGTTAPTWTPLVSGTTKINVDPTVTTTKDGVSVYVRVTVKNNKFETLTAQNVVMTLDGQNSLTPAKWDVRNDDCALPSPNAADQNDVATQTINPRPTVIPGTTSPLTPNTTLITKEP